MGFYSAHSIHIVSICYPVVEVSKVMGYPQASSSRHGWPWLSIETHGDFGIPDFFQNLHILPMFFFKQQKY